MIDKGQLEQFNIVFGKIVQNECAETFVTKYLSKSLFFTVLSK